MTGLPVAISIASSRLIPSSRDGCDLRVASPQHDRTFESRLNDVLAERPQFVGRHAREKLCGRMNGKG